MDLENYTLVELRQLAKEKGRTVLISSFLGMLIKPFVTFIQPFRKAFGSLIIQGFSESNVFEETTTFDESIRKSKRH